MSELRKKMLIRRIRRTIVVALASSIVLLPLWLNVSQFYSQMLCFVSNAILGGNFLSDDRYKFHSQHEWIICELEGRYLTREGKVFHVDASYKCSGDAIQIGVPILCILLFSTPLGSMRQKLKTLLLGLTLALFSQLILLSIFATSGKLIGVVQYCDPEKLQVSPMGSYLAHCWLSYPVAFGSCVISVLIWLFAVIPWMRMHGLEEEAEAVIGQVAGKRSWVR